MNIENKGDKKYKIGNHLVYSCQYHVIWSTKYRRKVLIDCVDIRIKELILEKQEEYGYIILEMEIMPDHVHLLIDVDPKIGVFGTINKIKGYTSNKIMKEFPIRKKIPSLWTHSKFISTVGSVSLETVKKYIEDQKNV